MKYKTKEFRKDNFFTMYDLNDNFVAYFDNFDRLSNYMHYECRKLVKRFNDLGNPIKLVIQNQKFYLYTFTDNELLNVTL